MELKYLVFSNEHRFWWRPDEQGYTSVESEAGRYSEEVADRICLGRGVIRDGVVPDEFKMIASECVEALQARILKDAGDKDGSPSVAFEDGYQTAEKKYKAVIEKLEYNLGIAEQALGSYDLPDGEQ